MADKDFIISLIARELINDWKCEKENSGGKYVRLLGQRKRRLYRYKDKCNYKGQRQRQIPMHEEPVRNWKCEKEQRVGKCVQAPGYHYQRTAWPVCFGCKKKTITSPRLWYIFHTLKKQSLPRDSEVNYISININLTLLEEGGNSRSGVSLSARRTWKLTWKWSHSLLRLTQDIKRGNTKRKKQT